jgi:hypothetical protein
VFGSLGNTFSTINYVNRNGTTEIARRALKDLDQAEIFR